MYELCSVAKITELKFWTDLLRRVVAQVLKQQGVRTRARTYHQHVVPHEEGWAVRGEGNKRVTAVYKYQDDAIRRAQRIARKHSATVVVHRKDGTIRDRMK